MFDIQEELKKLPDKVLKMIFILFLIYVSIKMINKAQKEKIT